MLYEQKDNNCSGIISVCMKFQILVVNRRFLGPYRNRVQVNTGILSIVTQTNLVSHCKRLSQSTGGNCRFSYIIVKGTILFLSNRNFVHNGNIILGESAIRASNVHLAQDKEEPSFTTEVKNPRDELSDYTHFLCVKHRGTKSTCDF